MAKGLSIKVVGIERLKRKFGVLAENVIQEVDEKMGIAAADFEQRAVNDAPANYGVLRNSITKVRVKRMHYNVISAANYSAYIEFGTKGKIKIPSDLTAYAAQFKGSGGKEGGKGFYDEILEWVKKKGIAGTYSTGLLRYEKGSKKKGKRLGGKNDQQMEDEQAAFAIYLSIMRHGIEAQPFFFKQRAIVYPALMRDIKQAYKKALMK